MTRSACSILSFLLAPLLAILVAALLAVSCSSVPVTKSPQNEESGKIVTWPYEKEAKYALQTYGAKLLAAEPKDIREWCPSWPNVDRLEFYNQLLRNMAWRESGHKPSLDYTESFKGSDGKYIVSRGLLQISQSSANQSAYGCGIKDATDLHSPGINLACGVKILSHWIPKDGYIAKERTGCGRYWSVCRPGNSKEYIRAQLRSFCR